MNDVLLISVGGSLEPIICSIINNGKNKLIFFASPDTRTSISQELLPELIKRTGKCPDHEFVITQNPESLGECVVALLLEVPASMRRLGIADETWPSSIDFTGGTKVMSASMVWASSKYAQNFSYIGGSSRSKNGVGVVIGGQERFLIQENPWDKVAYFELETAMLLFNRCQFDNAAEMLDGVENKVSSPNEKALFICLKEICLGFHAWDIFDHHGAISKLESSTKNLLQIARNHCAFAPQLAKFAEASRLVVTDKLRNLTSRNLVMSQVYDLLANANRRAQVEKKYEDACARCYSAFEKAAKLVLMENFQIDNSRCKSEQLPESVRSNFVNKYSSTKNPKILQFGLMASFELLREFGDPVAERFFARENVENHLQERNNSILAHGVKPLSQQHFEDIFGDVLAVFEINDQDLPKFPQFDIFNGK